MRLETEPREAPMLGAMLYIIGCSARNRARRRLARLREPRYIVGALAGISYAVFTLYMRHKAFIDTPSQEVTRATLLPLTTAAVPVGSLLLAGTAAASWFMPFESGLLRLSGAEAALLLPAPMTRLQLLLYRLLRSQLAVLAGALIFALAYPTGSVAARARGLAGAWMLLMITHVFFTGVTLTRATLRTRPRCLRHLVPWPGVLISFAPLVTIMVALGEKLAEAPVATAAEALAVLAGLPQEGILHTLLAPYRSAIGPLLAPGGAAFGQALGSALLTYAAAILWVAWAYESVEPMQGVLERTTAATARSSYSARPLDLPLRPRGRAEVAFIWKAALQTFRVVDRRVLLRIVLIVAWATLAAMVVSRTRGFAQLLGLFAGWATLFAVLMAPQVLRLDLRQDLEYLALLKTWPVPGRSIVRGEILWPTAVVSVLAWVFGAMAWLLADSVFGVQNGRVVDALACAALLLVPGVVAIQYTVHNGIAVLFPAWVPIGPMRPRGVDAIGQRLILLGGTWVLLAAALLPTALIAWVLWRWFDWLMGVWVLVPSALIGSGIVWGEWLVATRLLGAAFDRLDVTSTEQAE